MADLDLEALECEARRWSFCDAGCADPAGVTCGPCRTQHDQRALIARVRNLERTMHHAAQRAQGVAEAARAVERDAWALIVAVRDGELLVRRTDVLDESRALLSERLAALDAAKGGGGGT